MGISKKNLVFVDDDSFKYCLLYIAYIYLNDGF